MEIFVVTHSQHRLIDGTFSTQEKAERFILVDSEESGIDKALYIICKTHLDKGDSCYIRNNLV